MNNYCVTLGKDYAAYWFFINAHNFEMSKTCIYFYRDGIICGSAPNDCLYSLELVEGDIFTKIDLRKE